VIYRAAVLGAAGASFSPLDVSGLQLWLDASDASTITESSGSVSQWDDKSGNGNHVTQGTAANQPTTGTQTINSLNALDFDGGDWLLSSGNLGVSNSTNFSVFAVAILDSDDKYTTIFGTGNFGLSQQAAAFQVATNPSISSTRQMATDIWNPAGMVADTSITLGTEYVFSYLVHPWSSARSGSEFFLNGANDGAATYGTVNPFLVDGPAFIGAFGPTLTSSRWNGQIAEVLVYDSALSTADREAVEAYLADKWGITLS